MRGPNKQRADRQSMSGMAAVVYKLRMDRNETQVQFAERLGVTRVYLAQMERGALKPGAMVTLRIGALAAGEDRKWVVERLRERFAATPMVGVIEVLEEVAGV